MILPKNGWFSLSKILQESILLKIHDTTKRGRRYYQEEEDKDTTKKNKTILPTRGRRRKVVLIQIFVINSHCPAALMAMQSSVPASRARASGQEQELPPNVTSQAVLHSTPFHHHTAQPVLHIASSKHLTFIISIKLY